jgi:hypothetical protein
MKAKLSYVNKKLVVQVLSQNEFPLEIIFIICLIYIFKTHKNRSID